MSENNKYEKMYHILVDYELKVHEKNQKRIKYGLRCAIIIPLIFMSMLFWLGGSKVIYMTLWICSLFGICGYLVLVEYMDIKIQKLLREVNDEDLEVDSLIGGKFDDIEAKAVERASEMSIAMEVRKIKAQETMEEKKAAVEEKKAAVAEAREERKAAVAEAREERKAAITEAREERKAAIAEAIEKKKGGESK